jgi:hypothetical protein
VNRTDGKCFGVQENLKRGDETCFSHHVVNEKRYLRRSEEKRFSDPMFMIRGDNRFVPPPKFWEKEFSDR